MKKNEFKTLILLELKNLECTTHPLNYLERYYYCPIINNINKSSIKNKRQTISKKNSIYISHTSKSILQNPDNLRSIRTILSLKLSGIYENNKLIINNNLQIKKIDSHIKAKESVAAFNIQKNNLLGLYLKLDGYRFYDYIYNLRITNKQIIELTSECCSIKTLLEFKEVDREYDLIVGGHPILEHLGCRLRIRFNNSEESGIRLKVFNLNI